jgi:hypothetical protein
VTANPKRIITKKHARLVVNQTMLPCLVIDISQGGFRLRGSFKLTHGQLVQIILDDTPLQLSNAKLYGSGTKGQSRHGKRGYAPLEGVCRTRRLCDGPLLLHKSMNSLTVAAPRLSTLCARIVQFDCVFPSKRRLTNGQPSTAVRAPMTAPAALNSASSVEVRPRSLTT